MKTPFEMNYFLAFGFIGLCIYAGVFLRAKIPFLQRFLVPSCMIGGIIGMVLLNLDLIPLDVSLFHEIAYHFFIISFISIGLTGSGKKKKEKGDNKRVAKGALWMGLMNGASMSSQALLGALLMLLFGVLGMKLPLNFGLFLPLGFTQGPGQALAVGKAWEAGGFTNAITIGLAFAAIGFFFSLFVGIPLINWGIKKGYTKMGKVELPEYFRKGLYGSDEQTESMGTMTTHSGNVDSMAFQCVTVGIVYLLTYTLFYGLEQAVGQLSSATWGFFFFYGMVVGLLFRLVMNQAGAGHLLDPQTQNRITGFSVDVLLTATLISVKLAVVWEYIIPLTIVALAGGIWTTGMMLYFGRRVDDLGFERMMVQYGCNTGTVSTGLVLLRVVDPNFRTSAALETGLYSIFATPFILGIMLVILYGPKWGLNAYQQIGIYAGGFVLALILLKVFKLWGKRTW